MTKHERYNRSPKGKARYARYLATAKGRQNDRRQNLREANRRRVERIHAIEEELR